MKDNVKVIIIVFVDDLIIASGNVCAINVAKELLSNKFEMKDLGQLSCFLGMQFKFENDCVTINQGNYLGRLSSRFKMSNCKPKCIPCDPSVNKLVAEDSKELADGKLYREIVGSLIYVMGSTRPDLCYVVTKLSQYMSCPTKAHLNLRKYVLKYINPLRLR